MSYRREDTAWAARWLFDQLTNHFGTDQVFKDVDWLEPGDDFVRVITSAVETCHVFLVLIGRQWLTLTDQDGQQRLDNSDDFVRLEIETALARNIRIIPILIDGTRMPRADQLPRSLVELANRHALELSQDRGGRDFRRLLEVLQGAIATAKQLARQQAEEAARRNRRIEQLQTQLRERAAALDWDAAVTLGSELAKLDPAAADPDGLASTARQHIARRQQAKEEEQRRNRRIEQLQTQLRERAAALDWDAAVTLGSELAKLDPAAADPDGLASAARQHIARRQQAKEEEERLAPIQSAANPLGEGQAVANLSISATSRTPALEPPSVSHNTSVAAGPSLVLHEQQKPGEIRPGLHATDEQPRDSVTRSPRPRVVPITAEWALFGIKPGGTYGLIKCSVGTFSQDDFNKAFTHYFPGILGELPKKIISWFPGTPNSNENSFLGIAIRDRPGIVTPATSHNDIQIKFFYVPFKELAAGTVTYEAMYEGFSKIRLPTAGRAPVTAEFAINRPARKDFDTFTMRTAALLLTTYRVCILGAEQVDIHDKLRFIDMVASLMPHGMLASLAISTWVNSSGGDHGFRLFFTDKPAPRMRGLAVSWKEVPRIPVGDGYADDYLEWLREDPWQCSIRLAAYRKPIQFERGQILRVLNQLEVPVKNIGQILNIELDGKSSEIL